jgi:hypothetical protein
MGLFRKKKEIPTAADQVAAGPSQEEWNKILQEKSSSWKQQVSGGATYYSCQASSLYVATELLRNLPSIPPNTYYVVDTPDGSLGRDVFGFYTEEPIKTSRLKIEVTDLDGPPVDAASLTEFGDAGKSMMSVATLKSVGQYARFVLQMECGRCGYRSPVETEEGHFDRQCYMCGTVNHTTRGKLLVTTQQGVLEI